MILYNGETIELTEFVDRMKQESGEDNPTISINWKQFKCHGYDVYDPSDYHIEVEVEDE